MNPEAVQNALIDQLSQVGADLPPALPNRDYSGGRPYIKILATMGDRTGGSLAGGEYVRERGRMALNIVVATGNGSTDGNGYATTIRGLFNEGRRFPFSGGHVVIFRPVEIRAGFRDGPDWKVPVVIHYEAFA